MYFIKGTLKNILKQTVITKEGNSFETITLQVEGQSSSGRIFIEDIRVGKDKKPKVEELKVGTNVELPVAILVKNGYKNVYLQ